MQWLALFLNQIFKQLFDRLISVELTYFENVLKWKENTSSWSLTIMGTER